MKRTGENASGGFLIVPCCSGGLTPGMRSFPLFSPGGTVLLSSGLNAIGSDGLYGRTAEPEEGFIGF